MIKREKKQPTEREKKSAQHVSGKSLASRM